AGKFLYVADVNTGDICSFAINQTTGALSTINARVLTGDAPVSLNVDPSGKFLYVANAESENVATFVIDPTTGAITSSGSPAATSQTPSFVVTVGGPATGTN